MTIGKRDDGARGDVSELQELKMTERYGSLAAFLFLVIMTSAISGMINAGEWWYLITGKPNWTPAPWMR